MFGTVILIQFLSTMLDYKTLQRSPAAALSLCVYFMCSTFDTPGHLKLSLTISAVWVPEPNHVFMGKEKKESEVECEWIFYMY